MHAKHTEHALYICTGRAGCTRRRGATPRSASSRRRASSARVRATTPPASHAWRRRRARSGSTRRHRTTLQAASGGGCTSAARSTSSRHVEAETLALCRAVTYLPTAPGRGGSQSHRRAPLPQQQRLRPKCHGCIGLHVRALFTTLARRTRRTSSCSPWASRATRARSTAAPSPMPTHPVRGCSDRCRMFARPACPEFNPLAIE